MFVVVFVVLMVGCGGDDGDFLFDVDSNNIFNSLLDDGGEGGGGENESDDVGESSGGNGVVDGEVM